MDGATNRDANGDGGCSGDRTSYPSHIPVGHDWDGHGQIVVPKDHSTKRVGHRYWADLDGWGG